MKTESTGRYLGPATSLASDEEAKKQAMIKELRNKPILPPQPKTPEDYLKDGRR